jgi:hypothetical protein
LGPGVVIVNVNYTEEEGGVMKKIVNQAPDMVMINVNYTAEVKGVLN